jgi:CheY-like chemotaxis protein
MLHKFNKTAAWNEKTPTILLVEDDEMVMEVTCELLESSGYRVISTYLPRVALDLAKQGTLMIDLLVTDVVMPQMNGPELYRNIQKLLPNLPVLYISGYSDTAIQAVMYGEQTHFLAKPFTPSQLLEQITQILTV